MASPPTLLTIPLELRLEILESVLDTWPVDDELFYKNGAITPMPRIMGVCGQLRDESLPHYFRDRIIWFSTLGELGSALLMAPETVQYWKNIHIDWTGRRGLTFEGDRWHLEPGLEMLSKIPNVTYLSLGTEHIRHALGTDLMEEIGLITDQVQQAIPKSLKLKTLEIRGRIDSGLPPPRVCRTEWLVDAGGFIQIYERNGDGSWTLKQSLTQP